MRALAALPENRFAGAGDFAALARVLMLGRGSVGEALVEAEQTRGFAQRPAAILRAASTAGTTADPDWARPLVDYQIVQGGFLEALSTAGLFDRILTGGMLKVPLRSRIVANTVAVTGNAVGESSPKAITSMSLIGNDLPLTKVAAIVVLSEEVLRLSASGAEAFISRELTKGVVAASDTAFLAAITSGLTPIAAAGTDAAGVASDIAAALETIPTSASSVIYVAVSPLVAKRLSMMTGTDGHLAFPGMSVAGGTIGGIAVVATDSVADDQAVVIDASRIAGNSDVITLDGSTQASLLMDDAPGAGVAAPTNLWQDNLRALRAERWFAFKAVGACAALLDGVAWA
jgi:hypothetical protein